jgi:hypothetical protein
VKSTTLVAPAAVAAAISLAAPSHADNAPVNVPVTDAVRDQLLHAAALITDQRGSDNTGLTPGTIYYAYDPILDTYWAATSLVGLTAQDDDTSAQDANSYMVFRKSGQDGTWLASGVGSGPATTMPPAGNCPLPPAVHDLWQFMPNSCHP